MPNAIKWSTEKVIAVLGTRIAQAGMAGRPSPVAAKVLERLEAAAVAAKGE